ncbi:hypothetical protein [Paenibacillus sp. J22TS3]|uniref:hypothetical protein n=1 Tax=Paenibacillus sp. J22TS3 TaxID=2807192 RepID=UPI001BCC3B65|nr:hypothetical protein [Paenibacillus sp. J22TS3]
MQRQEDETYLGRTVFKVTGHKQDYEITFFSKRGKEWDYSLHFANESGDEDELLAVDARIEEDDEWFDRLLDAAMDTLPDEE